MMVCSGISSPQAHYQDTLIKHVVMLIQKSCVIYVSGRSGGEYRIVSNYGPGVYFFQVTLYPSY